MAPSVLVVEDQEHLRNAVRALLEGEGYRVVEAATPAEALVVLDRISPPCIVLWDTLTPTHDLSLVSEAMDRGVPVATLPVTVAPLTGATGSVARTKHLTSDDLLLSLVREHCPRAVGA